VVAGPAIPRRASLHARGPRRLGLDRSARGRADADDTAGALLALRHLGPLDDELRAPALAGLNWLLDLQNRDGGIPTFCRGWSHLPFDRSSPDLTAHALRAWKAWLEEMPADRQRRATAATDRALAFLLPGASARMGPGCRFGLVTSSPRMRRTPPTAPPAS